MSWPSRRAFVFWFQPAAASLYFLEFFRALGHRLDLRATPGPLFWSIMYVPECLPQKAFPQRWDHRPRHWPVQAPRSGTEEFPPGQAGQPGFFWSLFAAGAAAAMKRVMSGWQTMLCPSLSFQIRRPFYFKDPAFRTYLSTFPNISLRCSGVSKPREEPC